jgi:tRNA (guanine26-N2/guanine27-N2)-dimethyltransferase
MHFNNIFPLINNPTILCRPQDAPLYYTLPELAATLKMVTPPAVEVHAAILNAGYKYSRVHHESTGFKTDAPPTVIWDIMRACAKIRPPLASKHKKMGDAAGAILGRASQIAVNFTVPSALARRLAQEKSEPPVSRFPLNPEQNWGPKRISGRRTPRAAEKSEKNNNTQPPNQPPATKRPKP